MLMNKQINQIVHSAIIVPNKKQKNIRTVVLKFLLKEEQVQEHDRQYQHKLKHFHRVALFPK